MSRFCVFPYVAAAALSSPRSPGFSRPTLRCFRGRVEAGQPAAGRAVRSSPQSGDRWLCEEGDAHARRGLAACRARRQASPFSTRAASRSLTAASRSAIAGSFRAEAVDRTGEWIGLQLFLDQSRKSVHALAEVHGLHRHQHPHRPGRGQHAAHALDRQIARKTASTSRARHSTVMAPITSSMAGERTSCAGSLACPDSTDITGTKASSPSPGSAKRPSLAALIQFQRCCGTRSWRRATSAITASRAIASATIRPFSSSLLRRRRTTSVKSSCRH
jgi:hypothetical protein